VERDQRGFFLPGSASPNPNGRPVGTRARALKVIERMYTGGIEQLYQKLKELALDVDITALTFLLKGVIPSRKGVRICIDIPYLKTLEDHLQALSIIIHAMANGKISAEEAIDFSPRLISGVPVTRPMNSSSELPKSNKTKPALSNPTRTGTAATCRRRPHD
jgi:hypothetical protein